MKQLKPTPHITRPVQYVSTVYPQHQQSYSVHNRTATPSLDTHRVNCDLLFKATTFKHQRDLLLFYGSILIITILFIAGCMVLESTDAFGQLNKLYNECSMERDIYYSQLKDATKQNEALKLEIARQQATIDYYEQQLSAYETYTY